MEYKEIQILFKNEHRTILLCEYQNQMAIAKIYEFNFITEIERLQREVKILKLSKVFHQSVKMITSFIKSGPEKKFIIIMEYCSNGNLKTFLKKMNDEGRFFTQTQVWIYCKQFIELLAYLQTNEICHRDIKPENIFVTENGDLKLGDFGEGKQDSQAMNTIRGTVLYLSPKLKELYRKTDATTAIYDPYRSDVYSLGLVLLEMISMNEFVIWEIQDQINNKISKIKHPALSMIIRNMLWHDDDIRPNFLELIEVIQLLERKEKCCKCLELLEGQVLNGCEMCDFYGHSECMSEYFSEGLCIFCSELRNEIGIISHRIELNPLNLPLIVDFEISNYIEESQTNCQICFTSNISHSEIRCEICSQDKMICSNCGEIPHSCLCNDKEKILRCICQESLTINLSDLFCKCPNCGIICRVCLKSDTTKPHKHCAQFLTYHQY